MLSRRPAIVALAVAVAVAATGLYVWLYPYVNPTAALRMKVFRPGAEQRAAQFLASENVRIPAGYRRATTFFTSKWQKAYLEQTLGLPKANQVMQSQGLVYLWHVRWFKPGEQEQYRVWVSPDGEILAYWHYLPDDASAPESHRPQQVARAFAARASGVDLAQYQLKDSSQKPRPNRRDYTYTWERRGFRLGQATQRVSVTVTGDRVVHCTRYLHIPEQFYHRYSRQQQKGNLLARLAAGLSVIFLIAAVVAVIRGVRRRELRSRAAFVPALLVAGVGLLNDINALPLRYAAFDVRETDFAFVMGVCVTIGKSLLWRFFGVAFLVAAAEWFHRRAFPHQVPIPRWFSRNGLASAPGRKRLLLGYWLIPLQLAYVAVFYFLAHRYLRAWAPAQVRYDDLFSTALPWAFALFVGVQASVWEEFLFRVLAISWLKRLLKRDWLAILIPALIWGFSHCSYPNKPFYIRGIEVAVWGVAFGWVFVRFGILPSLVAHAGYNAVVTGASFAGSILWLPRLNFAVVLALALVPLAAAWWWSRLGYGAEGPKRPSDEQLQAAPAQQPAAVPLAATEPAYRPLPRRAWAVGGALLLLGLALVGVVRHLDKKAARYPWAQARVSRMRTRCLHRVAAVRMAREALAKQGADVAGWVMSAVPKSKSVDSDTETYLRQFLSRADVSALARRVTTPGFFWVVRWQKPLQREHWRVRIRADGKVWDVQHGLPEEAPGLRLSPAKARALAVRSLKEQGVEPNRYRLTGKRQHDYPHRTAHFFTWEPEGLRIGEAQFLTRVSVDGDRASSIQRWITIPESYLFTRTKQTPLRAVGTALVTVASLALLTWLIVVYFTALRRYQTDWWWGVMCVAGVGVPALALAALELPAVWARLPADVSPSAFLVGVAIQFVVSALVVATVAAAVLPVSIALWQAGFPGLAGPRFWWRALWQPRRHQAVWREAVLAQVIVCGVVLALAGAWAALDWALPPAKAVSTAAAASIPHWLVKSVPAPSPAAALGMDGLSPVSSTVLMAVVCGAGALLVWLGMAALSKAMFRTKRRAMVWYLLLVGIPILFEPADWRQTVTYGAAVVLGALGLWALYRLVLRTNPLALSVSAISAVLVGSGYDLMWYPAHRPAAMIMIAACALLLLWAMVTAVTAGRAASTDGLEPASGPSAKP